MTLLPQPTESADVVGEHFARTYGRNIPVPPSQGRAFAFRGYSDQEIDGAFLAGLEYFTKCVFRYPDGTTNFQNRVLSRVFFDKNVLGIAATGSGKSLCFWLPALLKPGLTIVISPLRSLMRDQRASLLGYGIASVEFLNSDIPAALHRCFLSEAKLGYVRLLYVSPERLRIKSFLEELQTLRDLIPINFVAIDEAHCISEWGHDFRPSYLKIPQLLKSLKPRCGPPPRIIALTATAGQKVEADVLSALDLSKEGGDVVRDKMADRGKFSYQVVCVDDSQKKTDAYKAILCRDIPRALGGGASLKQVLEARNQRKEKSIGIVFCIFADPHGKSSTTDGILHYLYETKELLGEEVYDAHLPGLLSAQRYQVDAFSRGRVRAFASKKPRLCPNCKYYGFMRSSQFIANADELANQGKPVDDGDSAPDELTVDDLMVEESAASLQGCPKCGYLFPASEADSPPNWDKLVQANQVDFKNSKFDILVATKGFGMGIDKSSVRFIVHTALSGGMESWYQEVGRAGRDDERAHVVLLVDPPNAKCREYLSSRQLMQPLCNYSQGCPYGKEALCDYGKQHMFIKRSYPGVVPDALRAVRLLDKVYTEAPSDEQGWAKVSTPHTQIAANELCLYRLMVLGVVEDYRITYARPGQPAHFHICLHPAVRGAGNPADSEEAAIEEIRKHLRWHLRDVRLSLPSTEERSLEQYVDTIKKLEKYHAMKPLYDAVFNNLRMLLRHTYSTVLTMRYDMLWGLLQVVTCTECRRKFILRHFQAENSVPDDYKCGLCDICNPSLEHFPAASRTPEMVSDAKLDAQFEALLARGAFDLPALDKMADAFSAHYSVSKFGRAWSVLEGDPTNLVALYFAIRFSEAEEPSGLIERLFLTANHLLPDRSIKELYGNLQRRLRGRLNLLARQLSVLNEGGSSCDTLVGWDFLAKEATASLPHGDEAVAMMGECLEFFLFVDRDLLGAVHRFRDRVVELEKEFHA